MQSVLTSFTKSLILSFSYRSSLQASRLVHITNLSIFFSPLVCITFLGRFYQSLKDKDVEFTPANVEKELLKSCKEAKGKENRLVSNNDLSSSLLQNNSQDTWEVVGNWGNLSLNGCVYSIGLYTEDLRKSAVPLHLKKK